MQLYHISFTGPLQVQLIPHQGEPFVPISVYEERWVTGGSYLGYLADITHLPYLPQLLFVLDLHCTAVLICAMP